MLKPYNNGTWSAAKFRAFVTSALRRASGRWGPKHSCRKAARIGRNQYVCSACKKVVGNSETHIDHINPVVDPVRGFQGWDEYVARLFVEADGFRLLCTACHSAITAQQREVRKANKK